MVQKCSIIKVLEVFFLEPTSIHFIKEISRRINLAPTSVRVHIADLFEEGLIIKKESRPFDGYVANIENDLFSLYKRAYNLTTLKNLQEKLAEILNPEVISAFGAYSFGKDTETSEIDILIISKVKKKINLDEFEQVLNRKIKIIIIDEFSNLDKDLQEKVANGFVIHGGFK